MRRVYLILHNIRSGHNVGSIFRTADGAGVAKIFLTGYTPKPTDEFGKPRKEIHKTALGAEKTVEWEYCRDIGKLLQKLKSKNSQNSQNSQKIRKIRNIKSTILRRSFQNGRFFVSSIPSTSFIPISIVGLEQTKTAVDYRKFKPEFPLALLVGNEVRGLSRKILQKCDAVIQIPMRGKKESLNVSVAAAIALYDILR